MTKQMLQFLNVQSSSQESQVACDMRTLYAARLAVSANSFPIVKELIATHSLRCEAESSKTDMSDVMKHLKQLRNRNGHQPAVLVHSISVILHVFSKKFSFVNIRGLH